MAPLKRALFSLNLDSETDHAYQRVDDHSKEGTDRVKVLQTNGPSHGHTDLSYIAKPLEKTVDRAINEVIDNTGKKVHSAEGEVHYSSQKSTTSTPSSTLSIKSKSKRRAIEKKYDTSEL